MKRKLHYIIYFIFTLFYLNSCIETIESKKLDKIYNLEDASLKLKLAKKEDLSTIIKEKQIETKVGVIKEKFIDVLQEFTQMDENEIQNNLVFNHAIDPENQGKLKIHISSIANSKIFKGSLDIYLEVTNEKSPIEKNQSNQKETSIEKGKNLTQFSYTPPSELLKIPFEEKDGGSKIKEILIKTLIQDSFFKGRIDDFEAYFTIDIKSTENIYQPYSDFNLSYEVGKHTLELRIRANEKGEKAGFIGESTFIFHFEILPLKGRDLSKEIPNNLTIDLSNASINENNEKIILWKLKRAIIRYLNRDHRWGVTYDYQSFGNQLIDMFDIKSSENDHSNLSKGTHTFNVNLSSSLEGRKNGFGGEKTFELKINIDTSKPFFSTLDRFNILYGIWSLTNEPISVSYGGRDLKERIVSGLKENIFPRLQEDHIRIKFKLVRDSSYTLLEDDTNLPYGIHNIQIKLETTSEGDKYISEGGIFLKGFSFEVFISKRTSYITNKDIIDLDLLRLRESNYID